MQLAIVSLAFAVLAASPASAATQTHDAVPASEVNAATGKALLPNGVIQEPTGPPENPPMSLELASPGSTTVTASPRGARPALSGGCTLKVWSQEPKLETGWGASSAECYGEDYAYEVQVCAQLYYSGGWHNYICHTGGTYATTNDYNCKKGYKNIIWGWMGTAGGQASGYDKPGWTCQ